MYSVDLAEVYDLVYAERGKDHAAESALVLDLVAERAGRRPHSLLDVACGTGAHLRHFARTVPEAEGLELSADMLAVARRAVPGARLHQGDMRGFDLGRRYSAVVCMFSSIGYMRDLAELKAAIAAFARHVEPGGVAVVEPWWFPADFTPGHIGADQVGDTRRTVTRISHSVLDGGSTRMDVHYLVAEEGVGIRYFNDTHLITLFERADYESAFSAAGFTLDFTEGPSGRGLFIGVRQ